MTQDQAHYGLIEGGLVGHPPITTEPVAPVVEDPPSEPQEKTS